MNFSSVCDDLRQNPKTFLVTGAAGFIGSHLCEELIELNQNVVALDNFSTGSPKNIEYLKSLSGKFRFLEGSICDLTTCQSAAEGADFVLHNAALGSVPRSIKDPISTHQHNVDGFINMIWASHQSGVKKFVYASSSSVYGDSPRLPKIEDEIGQPLSPYAATKAINETYATTFYKSYGLPVIGLRYFNVFGPRQSPNGPYAAVMPRWMEALRTEQQVEIFGDGETSRDFCYVKNVTQINLLAATTKSPEAINQVYNVAYGQQTTLNELFKLIGHEVKKLFPDLRISDPVYKDFRPGDIRHSLANIEKAQKNLGYSPVYSVQQGLEKTVPAFLNS